MNRARIKSTVVKKGFREVVGWKTLKNHVEVDMADFSAKLSI